MASPSSARAYEFLDFNSPMSYTTAAALVEEVSLTEPKRIVDVGCGWAELLLRVLEVLPTATGLGIDNDEQLTERARRNASTRGLMDRVSFRSDLSPIEQADIALCIGSEHVFGTLEDALQELRAFVAPGRTLLLGTLFWEQPPSPELASDFAEVEELAGVLGAAESSKWEVLGVRRATIDDWDRFEHGYIRDWDQLALTAESEAARTAAQTAADEYRADYLKRRGILGFVYLTLRRHSTDTDVPNLTTNLLVHPRPLPIHD